MSKLYEVTVSTVLSKEFIIKANSEKEAEDYGSQYLTTELDLSDWCERNAEVQLELDSIEDYPLRPSPEVIDITKKKELE